MIQDFYVFDNIIGNFIQYNTRLKRYSNGDLNLIHTSYIQYKGKPNNNKKNGSSSAEQLERYKLKRLHNRRALIYDLGYENNCIDPWKYFVTLTFNDKKTNGYDFDNCTNKLKNWLDTIRRNNPNMKYIIVPELHKSGRIHFHGLFTNVPNWQLSVAINPKTNKPIVENGSIIYNLVNYKLGFSTISVIKNKEAVIYYITKYITKELLDKRYKKNYWCSRNLVKPNIDYYFTRNINDLYSYLNRHNEFITSDKSIQHVNNVTHFIRTSHNI